MKRMIHLACIAYACTTSMTFATYPPYDVINAAQEKLRIVLKQIQVTYNWLDTLYAARERYYLSGIALDYVKEQKQKCNSHRECSALVQKLEKVTDKLHVLNLSKKEFELIQCEAEPLIQLPLFATKMPALVVT